MTHQFYRKSFAAVILATTVFATHANAGLLIEPYMGFETGTTAAASSSADLTAKTSGMAIGARIGYSLPVLFWAGLDYSLLASGTAKPTITGSDYTFSRSDLYLVAGVNLPILLRAWLGYGLANTLTAKKATGDETYKGGTNYKIGVGFTMLPMVTLYVEAYHHKSSSVDGPTGNQAIDAALSGGYQDAGLMFGASLPLDL